MRCIVLEKGIDEVRKYKKKYKPKSKPKNYYDKYKKHKYYYKSKKIKELLLDTFSIDKN